VHSAGLGCPDRGVQSDKSLDRGRQNPEGLGIFLCRNAEVESRRGNLPKSKYLRHGHVSVQCLSQKQALINRPQTCVRSGSLKEFKEKWKVILERGLPHSGRCARSKSAIFWTPEGFSTRLSRVHSRVAVSATDTAAFQGSGGVRHLSQAIQSAGMSAATVASGPPAASIALNCLREWRIRPRTRC